MRTMPLNHRIGTLAALTGILTMPVWAGNKILMEKEGKELVSINEQVIKELPNVQNNSQVKLEANVVQREGKTEIHIQRLSFAPGEGDGKVKNKSAQPSAPAAKKSESAAKPEKAVAGGASALSSDDMKVKIDEMKTAHPKLRFVEVDKAAVQTPELKESGKPGRAFIAIWDE